MATNNESNSGLWFLVGAVIVAVLSEDALGGLSVGVIPIGGQGASFVAAGTAFVVDVLVSYVVSLATQPKPAESLRGLVYSETPKEDFEEDTNTSFFKSPTKLAGLSLLLVIILNVVFH